MILPRLTRETLGQAIQAAVDHGLFIAAIELSSEGSVRLVVSPAGAAPDELDVLRERRRARRPP